VGYLVKKVNFKKRQWKLQFESWKGGKRKINDVPVTDWAPLGFHPQMTLEQARARAASIRAQKELARHEERRNAIHQRLAHENLIVEAYLGPKLVEEFERTKLFSRLTQDQITQQKLRSHWKAAKDAIFAIKTEVTEWQDAPEKFYDYFGRTCISPSYASKLLRLINMWGFFYARKHRLPFMPIPAPRGREKERLADTYFDKTKGESNQSSPLTPAMLEGASSKLRPDNYQWLHLTVWLGLRPSEVDRLKVARNYRLAQEGETQVLWVYQEKLVNIPRDQRWKPIPCFLPEQRAALEYIAMGQFRRPLSKTLARLWPGVGLYGGRKGFVDLMLGQGQSLEDISIWMGHRTIERTWRNYANRQRVNFKKPA
jgi:hypothetical protein